MDTRESSTNNPYSIQLIILGAGRAPHQDLPPGLVPVQGKRSVLDWLINAFHETTIGALNINLVSGFKHQTFEEIYPEINFTINSNWDKTGPLQSFALALRKLDTQKLPSKTFITYSDVLYRPYVVDWLSGSDEDVAIAIDSGWRTRYEGRSQLDRQRAEIVKTEQIWVSQVLEQSIDLTHNMRQNKNASEFCGIMALSPRAVSLLKDKFDSEKLTKQDTLLHLISFFLEQGLSVQAFDILNDWCELNAPQDLAKFILGSKAESLARLENLVSKSKICPQYLVSYESFQKNPYKTLNEIKDVFASEKIIVRSCSTNEDKWNASAAGSYLSVLDIDPKDDKKLLGAISEVFASYDSRTMSDQVLVQPMLNEVTAAGVVFTRVPASGAPYYIINYETKSGRTDLVTGGQSGQSLFVHHRSASDQNFMASAFNSEDSKRICLTRLVPAINEFLDLVGHDSLDIEFAIENEEVYVFQVRPITSIDSHQAHVTDAMVHSALENCETVFKELCKPRPFLLGSINAFSNMSDWNPAEIIGQRPNPLACSLYRHIITDHTWAKHRREFGYRDVRHHNLLVEFSGQPYIDLQVDFNSFVPSCIPSKTAEKLINYYLNKIQKQPHLHDKVEFEILKTCISFDHELQCKKLLEEGFNKHELDELTKGLIKVTKYALDHVDEFVQNMALFEKRSLDIERTGGDPLWQIDAFLEEIRNEGALNFSHLARCAFIATEFLKSAVRSDILSTDDVNLFLSTVQTTPSLMGKDAWNVKNGDMNFEEFVSKYGHLRPGTYDITSDTYAKRSDSYLLPVVKNAKAPKKEVRFQFSSSQWNSMISELSRLGIETSPEKFEHFLRSSIEQREMAKFIFTRSLSRSLDLLEGFAKTYGFNATDISMCSIQEVLNLKCNQHHIQEELQMLIEQGLKGYSTCQSVNLPCFLKDIQNFRIFHHRDAEPNFIGTKKIAAEIQELNIENLNQIKGKIVMIPNADPGYDLIFGHEIAGLITMYGGVNSHMAVRASELNLPAAIGVGTQLYNKFARCSLLELDCLARKIAIIGD